MSGKDNGILLKSGTNELEIILFELGDSCFAINVLKTREIITPLPITKIPNSHEHIEGIISLRGELIPVVNLANIVSAPQSEELESDKFIIAELNRIKIALRVHEVSRISRISWEQIEKPNELSAGNQPYATGIIKLDDNTLSVLLDIEKIVVEINPELGGNVDSIKTLGPRDRSSKKIIAAEDSGVLRALLKDTLTEAGYEKMDWIKHDCL